MNTGEPKFCSLSDTDQRKMINSNALVLSKRARRS